MLYRDTVKEELLELLGRIMKQEEFARFNLVGGTALALQIGHRNSVDIDLFGNAEIELDRFIDILSGYGNLQIIKKSPSILITSVNDIKIDLVNYKYDLLKPFTTIENIRLASIEDIAAMKLNAIAGRGSKKDFIDLFFLLSRFSLEELFEFYSSKYTDGSQFMVLKSLTYFADADNEAEPKMYLPFDWKECKEKINRKVNKMLRN